MKFRLTARNDIRSQKNLMKIILKKGESIVYEDSGFYGGIPMLDKMKDSITRQLGDEPSFGWSNNAQEFFDIKPL